MCGPPIHFVDVVGFANDDRATDRGSLDTRGHKNHAVEMVYARDNIDDVSRLHQTSRHQVTHDAHADVIEFVRRHDVLWDRWNVFEGLDGGRVEFVHVVLRGQILMSENEVDGSGLSSEGDGRGR